MKTVVQIAFVTGSSVAVACCILWALSKEKIWCLQMGVPSASLNVQASDGLIMVVAFYPQIVPRGFWIGSYPLVPSWTHDRVGDDTGILSNDRHTLGPFGVGLRHEWGERFFGFWLPFWALITPLFVALFYVGRRLSPRTTDAKNRLTKRGRNGVELRNVEK